MSIARATALLVSLGTACAIAVAVFFHSEAPQGLLLYTPGPNTPVHYTPASALGLYLSIGLLLVASALTAAVAAVLVWGGMKRLVPVAKTATFCGLGFAAVFLIFSLTERLWL